MHWEFGPTQPTRISAGFLAVLKASHASQHRSLVSTTLPCSSVEDNWGLSRLAELLSFMIKAKNMIPS